MRDRERGGRETGRGQGKDGGGATMYRYSQKNSAGTNREKSTSTVTCRELKCLLHLLRRACYCFSGVWVNINANIFC